MDTDILWLIFFLNETMKFIQAFIILIYDIVVFQRSLVGDTGGGITYFRSTGNCFWSPVVRHSFLSVHLLTFSFQLFYQNNWVYKPNLAQNILWRSSIPSFLNKYLFNLLEIRLDRVTLRYAVLKVPSILLPLYIYYCSVNEHVRFLKLFHYMTN